MTDLITIRDNLISAGIAMGFRQLLLIAGGALFPWLAMTDEFAGALATAIVVVGTLAYGQVRGWIDKRRAVQLAQRAPNARVVK